MDPVHKKRMDFKASLGLRAKGAEETFSSSKDKLVWLNIFGNSVLCMLSGKGIRGIEQNSNVPMMVQ